MRFHRWLFGLAFALSLWMTSTYAQAPDSLRVPAFTAFIEPQPNGLRVSQKTGIAGWTDPSNQIAWYGELKVTGQLQVAVSVRLPKTASVQYALAVAGQTLPAEGKGDGAADSVAVNFDPVVIPSPGYYRIALAGLKKDGETFGNVEALLLTGAAVKDAHFSLVERRNAASVHLGYPIPRDSKVEWFYNEVTVRTEPLWSYYMACGFHRGYFGIQVNSPTERRIIFSVWDSGGEAIGRNKVSAADRVQLLDKGEGVVADSFGNEGTGGHSHLVYPWKKDETYRFLVTAKPAGTSTIYTGYFFFPEQRQWGIVASFRAPKDGGYLRGLYSFNENFAGANGQLRRLAEFGNGWIRTADGPWTELTTARFTHDSHGKADRKDYGAGVVNGRFYLSNGGFVAEPVQYGDTIQRPGGGQPLTEIVLPKLPDKSGNPSQKNEAPLFRFGLFADVQYADKEAQGPRHYRESAAKLKACVDDFNQRDLAFVVNLGDLIDGHGAQSEPELKQMLNLVKPLHAPLHHVIGNHCLEVERPALMRALNLSSSYYEFERPGWRFIVLDGMDVSQRSVKGSTEAEAAQEFLKNNPQLFAYNGALGQRQLTWLKQQLAEAKQSQQRVIVFCHHPIEVTASDASHVLWNHAEVAKLLADFGCVVAWFNGHDHRGGYAARNGIHHVTLPGIVEAPADGNRYAVVEVYADRLIIQGIGDVPQRNLNLHPVKK